ncbi:hypothetical protein [Laribacter hongkongensis]|uniref:hypothetical protein n=1 Tax=Laribacter hongkongensis TaxID=168471 RepID=UPI001EFEC898|nr:hypothetical protein [Laribacter hongkongensis]MCG9040007.1 hypothetical protein [Laribacter hongkongensis]MCG9068854.1 hypothetical protein [Laribacter hongkongensis]
MTKIQTTLLDLCAQQRFVFWHNTDASFADDSHWLFYSQQPQPAPEDDWLLDVRLRGKAFHADEVSLQLEELGLHTLSLHGHLKTRAAFGFFEDGDDLFIAKTGLAHAGSLAVMPTNSLV